MFRRWSSLGLVALFGFVLLPGEAFAHLGLIDPPSRYGPDVLKTAPCGRRGGVRSGNVLTLAAGSTIEIRWDEYIDHPGHYRVAFDPDGDDDFRDPACVAHCDDPRDPMPPEFETGTDPTVLLDSIPDMRGGEYSVTVTLPDIACDNCTLQVIQVMYDKRPYTIGGNDNYYQCVDLVLTRDGPPPPPPPDDAGTPPMGDDAGMPPGVDSGGIGTPDAATPPDAAIGRDSGPSSGGTDDDGCGCGVVGARAPASTASALVGILGVVFVLGRTRRRRRGPAARAR